MLQYTLDAYYQSPQVQARYRQPEQTVVVNVDVEDEAGTVKGTELIALKSITHSPPQEEALSSASRSRVSTESVSPSPTPTRTSKPKERRERASSQPFQDILDMDVSKICWECRKVVIELVTNHQTVGRLSM